jgi:hypothetical protein
VERGSYCSVREINPGIISISTTANLPSPKRTPATLWEVLTDWGHSWMWKHLQIVGEDHWLQESIQEEEYIAVTDGSYMKDLFPQLNLAAFIFECQKGRGRLVGS